MADVYILGGGVAGLSAAHELAERRLNVTVFERRRVFGGKARSMDHEGSGSEPRPNLPAEHGFRFFPGFYRHLTDTLSRIDLGHGRTVKDRLVEGREIGIALSGKPVVTLPGTTANTPEEWILALWKLLSHYSIGVSKGDVAFFVQRIACFIGSCEQRRVEQYEGRDWWDFLDAERVARRIAMCSSRG